MEHRACYSGSSTTKKPQPDVIPDSLQRGRKRLSHFICYDRVDQKVIGFEHCAICDSLFGC